VPVRRLQQLPLGLVLGIVAIAGCSGRGSTSNAPAQGAVLGTWVEEVAETPAAGEESADATLPPNPPRQFVFSPDGTFTLSDLPPDGQPADAAATVTGRWRQAPDRVLFESVQRPPGGGPRVPVAVIRTESTSGRGAADVLVVVDYPSGTARFRRVTGQPAGK